MINIHQWWIVCLPNYCAQDWDWDERVVMGGQQWCGWLRPAASVSRTEMERYECEAVTHSRYSVTAQVTLTPWHTFISTSSHVVTSHIKSKRVNQVITVVRSWIEFRSRSTRVHASSWYQENILFGAVKRRCFDDPVHCETPALIAGCTMMHL